MEQYHAGQVWIDEAILIGVKKIQLVITMTTNLNKVIKSVLGMTKKFTDNDIRKELGGGENMTVNSRGITIYTITDDTKRWVANIFNTWFCNIRRPSNLPKG